MKSWMFVRTYVGISYITLFYGNSISEVLGIKSTKCEVYYAKSLPIYEILKKKERMGHYTTYMDMPHNKSFSFIYTNLFLFSYTQHNLEYFPSTHILFHKIKSPFTRSFSLNFFLFCSWFKMGYGCRNIFFLDSFRRLQIRARFDFF